MAGSFTLITGGARSGKSSFAEEMAGASKKDIIYLATARIGDQEMEQRVVMHRQRRPDHWCTVEEPLAIAEVIGKLDSAEKLFLVDCLTLWLNNLLMEAVDLIGSDSEAALTPETEEGILAQVKALAETVQTCCADVILVTNEVGWGIVPPTKVGRFYRDLAGKSNQILAGKANVVYLVVAGLAQQLK